MIVSLKISDELYEHYAKRNPLDPRAALADALESFKALEPGVPRLVVENPDLRAIQGYVQGDLSTSAALLAWIRKTAAVKVGDWSIELSVGQRKHLKDMATALVQPLDEFAKNQLKAGIQKVVGV
jgi:hypothetical protein